MANRKEQNRNVLNSIRLTLLDWDPMDLFMMGQAGLEEYDDYIPAISKTLKKLKNEADVEAYLLELATGEMAASPDAGLTKTAAQKLFALGLSDA